MVMFQAVNILSGDGGGLSGRCGSQIQECWEFEHPRRDLVLDARGEILWKVTLMSVQMYLHFYRSSNNK